MGFILDVTREARKNCLGRGKGNGEKGKDRHFSVLFFHHKNDFSQLLKPSYMLNLVTMRYAKNVVKDILL